MTDWSLQRSARPWAYELRAGDTVTSEQINRVNKSHLRWMELTFTKIPGGNRLFTVTATKPTSDGGG